tara:strand:- start:2006 stop:2221 length:216 start_codon:yes stop_codon:yes gene_type:complete
MPAIITDRLKRQFAQQIFDENQGTNRGDSDNYFYIGIGHSQIWQPSANTDTTVLQAILKEIVNSLDTIFNQ